MLLAAAMVIGVLVASGKGQDPEPPTPAPASEVALQEPAPVCRSALGATKKVHFSGRLYFSSQFGQEDIEALREAGIARVISLRTPEELEWNERTALESAGIGFVEIPVRDAAALTDEVFDQVRKTLGDQSGGVVLLHCASANRVGATWLPYRVLDEGVPLNTALAEARIVGLRSPALLDKALAYIRRIQSNRQPATVSEEEVEEHVSGLNLDQETGPETETEQEQEKETPAPPKPEIRLPGSTGINDPFNDPDLNVDEFIGKFEVESREIYTSRQAIVDACRIAPGMHIADIGAGTGLFTRMFADASGENGWVYAVEIAPRFLQHIAETSRAEGITNVTGVLGTQVSVSLPPSSVDLVFICDTYHHFEDPPAILASIHRALKPGGEMVVVDFERIPGTSREWVLDHVRGGKEIFRGEIEEAGFQFVEQLYVDGLKENYFLRFRRE